MKERKILSVKDYCAWDKKTSPVSSNDEEIIEEEAGAVTVFNNHIYFYCGVDQMTVAALIMNIKKLEKVCLNYANIFECPPAEIIIHINSYGGDLMAGLAALDAIRGSAVPVRTIIEGCAASAATLISIAGDTRCITENSFMLIHQLSQGFYGKAEEIKDETENVEMFMNTLINAYMTYAKIPQSKLKQILKRDLWWSADQCKKFKLVDEVI